MAQRATSLGPKPSFFGFCFCFFVCCFFVCFLGFLFFLFFWGFKWPKGPPHLALNPPYLFCIFCCFLFFLCLFFICFLLGKPCFPPKKGNFCLFICVSLCFSLALFGPPLFFPFSFFVSLSCYFLSSFLPVFSSLVLLLYFSFCLVCFLVQDVVFLFCLLSSFVLNHHVWFIFALYLVFFFLLFLVFVAFIFCIFGILATYQKTSTEKFGNCKKNKNEKCTKKDILTRAVCTGVLTNSVFFSFLCFFKFCNFAENTIKIGVSAKQKRKTTHKKKQKT